MVGSLWLLASLLESLFWQELHGFDGRKPCTPILQDILTLGKHYFPPISIQQPINLFSCPDKKESQLPEGCSAPGCAVGGRGSATFHHTISPFFRAQRWDRSPRLSLLVKAVIFLSADLITPGGLL
jgi:hypothetical protein